MKKIGIIGITGYGSVHAKMVLKSFSEGKWKPEAAVVINPEVAGEMLEAMEKTGCRIYSDYQTMLEENAGQLDLICVPTAIHWHMPMVLDALRAGMDVFVEKPLAATLHEAEKILEVSEEMGRRIAVGFQAMALPSTWEVKDAIMNGEIGALQRIKCMASWPRNFSYYQRNNWVGKLWLDSQPVFDSPLNNALAHYVNLSLFFAGPVRRQGARVEIEQAALYRSQEIESFDTASVCARTEQGVEIWMHGTHSAEEARNPLIVIEGTEGKITWDMDAGVTLENAKGAREIAPADFSRAAQEYLRLALVEWLDGKPADLCDAEMASDHCHFIDQLHAKAFIHGVDAELIDSREDRIVIKGLNEMLSAAFEENRTLVL